MIMIKYSPTTKGLNYEGLIQFMAKDEDQNLDMPISQLWERTKASDYELKNWTIATDISFLSVHFIILPEADSQEDAINQLMDELAKAIRKAKQSKVQNILVNGAAIFNKYDSKRVISRRLAEASYLVANEGFKISAKPNQSDLQNIFISGGDIDEASINEGILLGEATHEARKLVNRPANDLTPEALANAVVALGKESGFQIEIHDRSRIEQLKMDAFLSVANGSFESPKLIVMKYMGDEKNDRIVGLVGKGLTYDSGGLSIKPTDSMVNMKDDMAGSAAVIGAFIAIAKAKLKINIVGVIAACENMISGDAYRPGDIITSMAGKTIFVANTDAEGRLTLVDAIHYISTAYDLSMLVDLATLTGSALHCLGEEMAPVVSNDDALYVLVERAFSKSGEDIWRMPMTRQYREKVKHTEADLTNSAGKPGMITAAAFLEAFVKEGLPWIHLDIAGTAFLSKEQGERPKGATGFGVRGLYHMAKKISK